jgi:hypothetical protein
MGLDTTEGLNLELVATQDQGGGFQPVVVVGADPHFLAKTEDLAVSPNYLDCAPCQIVRMVTRFARTR